MNQLCIPVEVWNCVARYYENPILLLRLARVCRNSYKGATMNTAWETLVPYECEGNMYKAFIKAVLATSEDNHRIIRRCWTGVFLPKGCLPADAFEEQDFDTALALATQNDHVRRCWLDLELDLDRTSGKDGHEYLYPIEHRYLFDKCIRSRKFMITALNLSPWLFDMYDRSLDWADPRHLNLNMEYCEIAMRHSKSAWSVARSRRFPARKNYDLRKRMLALDPKSFTYIFWELDPCSEPEFILGSAPFYLNSAEYFVSCCHPDVFGLELCEKLCRIGFPIWVAKPDIGIQFLKKFQCFTKLPPQLGTDREIFESVAKNNCEVLKKTTPEFRKDVSLILSVFEHNPGVLHYCDPTIFKDAEFLGSFKEALRKPNGFFFRTRPSDAHQGRKTFPEVLQTQELALIAVESYGQWIHYFPEFWTDFEVMKVAVVTWPLAYKYAPTWLIMGNNWSEPICRINPRAVWAAENQFIRENRSIVNKALQLGPLFDGYDSFPYFKDPFVLVARHIECVLPKVLRAHPDNYKILCLKEINRQYILRKKALIIAALEGTRDGSILWDVPPRMLDEDIWNKAREVRQ